MEIIRFYRENRAVKLRVETLEDLWSIERILFGNDLVRSESMRRFRSNETDKGELKEVVITLRVEKTELDKNAQRLRITGKIVEGRPEEFVRLNTYHTLNIAPKDIIEITKEEWPGYLLGVLKEAEDASKRPRLGIIAIDDEKALPAYILGYGIEFIDGIYSRLSKRMKPKDFAEQEVVYFNRIIDLASKMNTDVVILAGPGFTKDNVKKYMDENGITRRMQKRLMFMQTSNAERSGVYELIKSDAVAEILSREQLRSEFRLMEEFLRNLSIGKKNSGPERTREAVENREASTVMVNDNLLEDDEIKRLLARAERMGNRIVVFNSDDEAGQQLSAFGGIAAI